MSGSVAVPELSSSSTTAGDGTSPLPLPPSAEALQVSLDFVYHEGEAVGNSALQKAQKLVWYSRMAGVFAACNIVACIPLATWQLRQTDRVWRIRNPKTVHRHRIILSMCGGAAAVTMLIGLWSPIGLLSRHDALVKYQREADQIGWEALVLSRKLKSSGAKSALAAEVAPSYHDLTSRLIAISDAIH